MANKEGLAQKKKKKKALKMWWLELKVHGIEMQELVDSIFRFSCY